jgi:CDP-glycerol glycerophosphotransferase (TagB/SpsB family)
MCRQAAYRFPEEKIIKFGMRHGPYYFKPFANPRGYNMINRFFMTSQSEVEAARKAGIKTGVAIGYPKLDPAFDGSYDAAWLQGLRTKAQLQVHRPTLLLTATWDGSELSAVEQWAWRLSELAGQYNLLVTVHPWTSAKYVAAIRSTAGVYFIDDYDVVPWIMLADVCIGDYSSILAECCALDKPMMTFVLPDARRTVPEVKSLIEKFSERIHSFDELIERLPAVLGAPDRLQNQRRQAARVMFDTLDGKAGHRAAEEIMRDFPELRL